MLLGSGVSEVGQKTSNIQNTHGSRERAYSMGKEHNHYSSWDKDYLRMVEYRRTHDFSNPISNYAVLHRLARPRENKAVPRRAKPNYKGI